MKKTIIAALLMFAVIAFAGIFPIGFKGYDKSKAPKLSLPIAYDRAVSALGSETNAFHCISAAITTDFSLEGEWSFAFYSTNTNSSYPKFIVVKFDGSVIFDNGAR